MTVTQREAAGPGEKWFGQTLYSNNLPFYVPVHVQLELSSLTSMLGACIG